MIRLAIRCRPEQAELVLAELEPDTPLRLLGALYPTTLVRVAMSGRWIDHDTIVPRGAAVATTRCGPLTGRSSARTERPNGPSAGRDRRTPDAGATTRSRSSPRVPTSR